MEGFWTRISEPYARVTLLTWILLWVLPFWVLLGQRPKKTPAILGTIAAGSVFGFWIERYILVTPSLVTPEDVLAGAPVTPLGLVEIGIGLGFLGLFFLCFLGFSRVFPGVLPARGTPLACLGLSGLSAGGAGPPGRHAYGVPWSSPVP